VNLAVVVIVIWVVIVLAGVLLYNGLVHARFAVSEAWSAVQVQLQRRANLIPNLVETVSGYARHERGTFESVTRARAQLQSATTPVEAAQANNMLTQALRSLFAVAEAYPELKANQNFLDLQAQLSDTENKIAYARNYYNSRVLDYNTRISSVPGVFLAGAFGFQPSEFFKAEDASEEPVRVKLE
jgi:LemA protein